MKLKAVGVDSIPATPFASHPLQATVRTVSAICCHNIQYPEVSSSSLLFDTCSCWRQHSKSIISTGRAKRLAVFRWLGWLLCFIRSCCCSHPSSCHILSRSRVMKMFHSSCWCSRSLGYRRAPSAAAAALSKRGMFSTLLQRPEILFESNHLLVVNKPVGWHSMPNNDKGQQPQQKSHDENKCLLRYLVQAKLGGGSNRDFLKPLHRIDQPCSGVLLLGKTSKAASRIQSAWQGVEKTYLVVVERLQHSSRMSHQPPITDDDPLRLLFCNNSMNDQNDEWHRLSGFMLRRKSRYHGTTSTQQQQQQHQTNKGWSVTMVPDPATSTARWSDDATSSELLDDPRTYRHCTLEWRRVLPKASSSSSIRKNNNQTALLEVRTSQGARHMIRALFSCQGLAAVAGDLRYGAARALPDRSVALHAHTVRLPPTVKLGSTGALQQQRRFVAPIPLAWAGYFGITQDDKMRYTPS